ncbi:MAG: type II secretion system F family protein [Candidatus Nitricoxidivorans perseverans]|uniref:Type II secretion system F family protein n=1 Tax=Candidatus Nitricoxidivorans perseverans TaxID=2975601 RepID=A0AA49IY71_9PROT|nr:MAG: type II secretion system F family protein [Candidatus Nitricoxidivorans perseverans]
MHWHWLIAVALLLAGAGLVLLLLVRQREGEETMRRFQEVLESREGVGWLSPENSEPGEHGAGMLKRVSRRSGHSVEIDLRRVGWTSQGRHTLYYATAAVAPVAGMLVGGVWGAMAGEGMDNVAVLAFLGFGAGYLLPPRILGWLAQKRQKVMREEMLAVLHLLRMLFDAGLSLEHALRVISEQGRELVPQMATEIGIALARINAGQERGDALEEMAAPLDLPELSDTVAILKQATRYGGSLRDSLTRFAALIEDRRMTGLREHVSKLSAKMTVVMVVFMFPALMLFLAGPGFLALANALARI